jgi:two-component system, OmpR family, phosphate regulon sensor histidine kinase PhoR
LKPQKADYTAKILELRQTLSWMDIVLANVADSVCVINEIGKILFVNDSLARILKKDRISLLGKKFQNEIILAPKESSMAEPYIAIKKLSSSSDSIIGVYEWKLSNKPSITVKLSAYDISESSHKVVMLMNVTNQYQLEEISKNFATLASHQLRTPIAKIKTNSHILNDGYVGDLSEEQLRVSNEVIKAADHMNDLLNMLLEISKLENQKYTVRYNNVKVPNLLRKIIDEVIDKATQKQIEIITNIPRNMDPVRSDEHMLNEIFSNLITNAIKYTPIHGKIKISIATDSNEFVLIVEDNGIGIPDQYQSKIFTQFFRAQNAIDSALPGTGLGLYLVKHLVELLKGSINLQSISGKGTTFWITIPNER